MTADALAGLRDECATELWDFLSPHKTDFALVHSSVREPYMLAADFAIVRCLAFAAEHCEARAARPAASALEGIEVQQTADDFRQMLATAARGAT